MKKLILALLAVSVFTTADAQKGTILKYGTAGIAYDKSDAGGGNEYRSLNWHINPGLGYQFTDHVTIGLQGGYRSDFTEDRMTPAVDQWVRNAYEQREWHLGAFFRYTHYFSNIFFMFGQVDLSFVSGQDIAEMEDRYADYSLNTIVETVNYNYAYYNGFQASYTPMVGVFVNDGLALNFGIGNISYRTTSYYKGGTGTNNSFDMNLGNQFNFGISKNIDPHHWHKHMKPGDDLRPLIIIEDEDDDE